MLNVDKDEAYFHFLEEANETSEWLWTFNFKYMMCGFAFSTPFMGTVSILFYRWMHGHIDTRLAYRPYKMS